MPSSAYTTHDNIKYDEGRALINYSTDTFKAALFLSTSNVNLTNVDGYADATNELPTANGYTQGGITLTGVTWVKSGDIVTLDADDNLQAWQAVGGTLSSRYCVIYNDTAAGKPIVAHCLNDSSDVDLVLKINSYYKLTFPSGILQKS